MESINVLEMVNGYANSNKSTSKIVGYNVQLANLSTHCPHLDLCILLAIDEE